MKFITSMALIFTLAGCAHSVPSSQSYAYQSLVGTWLVGQQKYVVRLNKDLMTATLINKDGEKNFPIKIMSDGTIQVHETKDTPSIRIVNHNGTYTICNVNEENCQPLVRME